MNRPSIVLDARPSGPTSRSRLSRLTSRLGEPSVLLAHGGEVVAANEAAERLLGALAPETNFDDGGSRAELAAACLRLAGRDRPGCDQAVLPDGVQALIASWPVEGVGGPLSRVTLFVDPALAAIARFCLELPEPVLLLDRHGGVGWCNPVAERIALELGFDDVAALMPDHVFDLALALTSAPGEHAHVESRRGQRSFRWHLRGIPGMAGLVAQAVETTRQETSRRVLETSVDGIFEIDVAGRPSRVNRAMAVLFGFEGPAKFLEHYRRDGIVSLFRREGDFSSMIARLRDEGKISGFEAGLAGPDGKDVWALINVRALTDEAGEVVGFAGTLLDITERRKAQEQLKARGGRYRALVQTAGSVIVFVDVDGRIQEYNREAERVFGYSFFEAAGKNFYQLVFDTDHAKDVETKIRRLMAGEVIKDEETSFLRKDGERRIFQWNARAHFSEEGDISGAICIGQDVTARKSTELALREAEERYRGLFENATEGVFQAATTGRFIAVNPALAEMLGYASPGEVMTKVGDLATDFCADPAVYAAILERMEAEGEIEQLEIQLKRKEGGTLWAAVNGRIIRDSVGNPVHVEGSVVDITERRKAQERINFLAHHDSLTGLPNRVLFQERLSDAVRRANLGGGDFALLLMDLDGFKDVNDSLGHPIGDLLLQGVAERLQGCLRGDDTAARLGGDEFAVVLTNFHKPDDVARVADRIIERLGRRYMLDGNEVTSGCSLGVCIFPQDAADESELLRNADLALYCSKTEGRNRYHFFEPKMQRDIQQRQTLSRDLKAALAEDQMELFFQPVVEMTTGETLGMEALLRWAHPSRGLVPAAEFLGVAESSGLMMDLGDWVLRNAVAQASVWWNSARRVPVSVNLSAAEWAHGDELCARVSEALSDFDLSAEALRFDVSESVLMRAPGESRDLLQRLHAMGIKVALDDFGAGTSSFRHLRGFELDALKIAPDFITDLDRDAAMAAMVRGMVGLGEGMGLEIIAEGVETDQQRAALLREGVRAAQGHLLGAPAPQNDA